MFVVVRGVSVITSLFLASVALAQGPNLALDSILYKKSEAKRFDKAYQLGVFSLEKKPADYQNALHYGKKSLLLAAQANDSIRLLHASMLNAMAFKGLGSLDSSVISYEQFLSYAERKHVSTDLKNVYNALGELYILEGVYDKALSNQFKLLDLARKDGDEAAISVAVANIGLVYFKLKNYDKAISYYNDALQYKNEMTDKLFLNKLLVNLSLSYAFKNDFSMAKKYVKEVADRCRIKCADEIAIEAEYCEGMIAFHANDYLKARRHFLSSYETASRVNDIRYQLENLVYLSQIATAENNTKLTEQYLKEAESKVRNTEFNLLQMEINRQFYLLYEKTSDYEKEATYQYQYIQLRDSIYGEELTQHLMAVHAENEERENQAKIAAQNKVLQLKEDIITRQTILNGLAISIAVLLMALIFILYKNNRQKKRNNLLLEQRVKERSLELQRSYELMKRTYEEQDEVIQKASNDMRDPLETLKELCKEASKEANDEETQLYVKNLTAIVEQIEDKVNSLVQKDGFDDKFRESGQI